MRYGKEHKRATRQRIIEQGIRNVLALAYAEDGASVESAALVD